jgi:carnosine N-methyltransferase
MNEINNFEEENFQTIDANHVSKADENKFKYNEHKKSEVAESEERQHFYHIVNTFRFYKIYGLNRLAKTFRYLDSLPIDHQNKLTNYRKHLEHVSTAIEHNYEIIKLIIGDVSNIFENIDYSNPSIDEMDLKCIKHCPTSMDSDKVNSILKQIVREWTSEGKIEREKCFQPILDQIDECFNGCEDKSKINILVPGAGLGRLAFEIARKGYTSQGNEYSLFMLFTSNFILNKCKDTNCYTFYPWAQQYHNNLSSNHQLTRVCFPDINPSQLAQNTDFSMAAGNFTEIYKETDSWDCVSTCFFIDTANNVTAYIETIWNILKPGGVWINLGPLLYHYADLPNEDSIEPSYEIVREIILSFGFELINEKTNVSSYYTQNPQSMLAYEYRSVFFVGKKPINLN